MSWSYRSDNSDEMYSTAPGPTVVTGSKQAVTPGPALSVTSDTDKAAVSTNPFTVYTADGAVPVATGTAVLSKTSAAAMTLAAPTAAQNGMIIRFIAGTAYAHVVTATGLIDDGVTGGAKNTITLGAFVGAAATVMAYNLHWVLVGKTVATIA